MLIRGEKQGARLSVVLKPRGEGRAQVPVRNVFIEGFRLYPWRLWMGARSASGAPHHDVDNVRAVATGCPALDGHWQGAALSFASPGERALPIHAVLLPTGQVIFGDRHDFDPGTGSWTTVATSSYATATTARRRSTAPAA